jgi:hypothetical protein
VAARAVPPWLWMVLIRDHGPKTANARLVLHTLRSYMADDGSTFVGQTALALAACLSKPTVRKMLRLCWEERWIGVTSRIVEGRAWRRYEYRACVPFPLAIPERHKKLVEVFGAKYGAEVDTDNHPDHVRPKKVGNGLSHPNGQSDRKNTRGGKNQASGVGKSTPPGGKDDAHEVGNGLSPKFFSEVSPKFKSKGADETDRTKAELNKSTRTKTPESPEAKVGRIENALARKEFADYTDAQIARVIHVTLEEVKQIRSRA